MLKKYAALFSFLIFFLAQFGRVINYCFCTVVTYEQTSSFTCDCEKQLYTAVQADKHASDQLPQHISYQLPSEELFHLPHTSTMGTPCNDIIAAWPFTGSEALTHCYGNSVFHPPLTVS